MLFSSHTVYSQSSYHHVSARRRPACQSAISPTYVQGGHARWRQTQKVQTDQLSTTPYPFAHFTYSKQHVGPNQNRRPLCASPEWSWSIRIWSEHTTTMPNLTRHHYPPPPDLDPTGSEVRLDVLTRCQLLVRVESGICKPFR